MIKHHGYCPWQLIDFAHRALLPPVPRSALEMFMKRKTATPSSQPVATKPAPAKRTVAKSAQPRSAAIKASPPTKKSTFSGVPSGTATAGKTSHGSAEPAVGSESAAAVLVSSPLPPSKQSQIITLLRGDSGASMPQLMTLTGWQSHTVRGMLSGSLRKRLGLNVQCQREGGVHIYRIKYEATKS
jgi:hypothetical protein